MGQVNARLRNMAKGFMFFCPGCKEPHQVWTSGDGPKWGYNGNPDAPTFTPSILIRSGHYAAHFDPAKDTCWCSYYKDHPDEEDDGFTCGVCHSFVTDGNIQFLGDCTHALANQTVPIPDLPEVYRDQT